MEKILMLMSAVIVLILGVIHFIYTFWGPKLTPRDQRLREEMEQAAPVLTAQTTMWKAWVGFNASHSLGAILFGSLYGYFAIFNHEVLFKSPFLLVVGFVFLASLVVIG